MHISTMLVFSSLVLWFGIVWCWRSICCFWLLASLPYMSICPRVIIAISFKQVDHAPYAKSCAQRDYEYLQSVDCCCKKCHIKYPKPKPSKRPILLFHHNSGKRKPYVFMVLSFRICVSQEPGFSPFPYFCFSLR